MDSYRDTDGAYIGSDLGTNSAWSHSTSHLGPNPCAHSFPDLGPYADTNVTDFGSDVGADCARSDATPDLLSESSTHTIPDIPPDRVTHL